MTIYCLDNSEYATHDALSRGHRSDIYVKVNENFYRLNIYDMVRLTQDFETEIEEYGFYSIEPNLVIVNEVSNEEIKKVLPGLYKQKYFEEIKNILLAKEDIEALIPL